MTRRQPLLIAGCLLGSMGVGATATQAQSGVAYAGDMQSIDRAMLDAAEMPLPSMASGPTLTPRTAPQGNFAQGGVVQAGAQMPVMGVPNQATPAAFNGGVRPTTVDQPEQPKRGLFSKLKPSWPFGKSEAKQPEVDPFAQATQDARIQTVGAATKSFNRSEGVQRIPSYVASQSNNQQTARNTTAPQQRAQATSAPTNRSNGVVMRQDNGPKQGFLSGLWGGSNESSQQRPKAQPLFGGNKGAGNQGQRNQEQLANRQSAPAPSRMAMNSRSQSRVNSAGPTPSPSYLTGNNVPAKQPAAKPSSASEGMVMVSDEPAPVAKRSPIATFSPATPRVAAVGAPISNPAVANLSMSSPEVKTLENHFATTKSAQVNPARIEPAPVEEEPADSAIFASDDMPEVVSAPASEPRSIEPTPPNPTAAQGPVVVSLPPRPMPAPLPTDNVAHQLSPASQAPASYANTAVSQPTPVVHEATSATATERAKTLLTEAHQLAATADTADEYSAVLKRCSYVLAIDNSQEAIGYANQLAGWALSKRGEVFENENRLTEAEADYLDALRSDPECWRAEHALGVIAARNGNADEAGRRFNRTLLLNPEFAKAYSNRAALAVQRGDFEAALNDYQQAIEIDPDFEPAHTGRGRVCHMLGRLDEGLQHLDAAELLSPEDGMIATGRGDLLVDLGRYGQAKQAYERAISLDPQSPAAYRNLAWMQATCPQTEYRDGAAAVANIEKASQLAGGSDDLTLDTKAAALAAAGRYEEAAKVQQEAIAAAPESDAAAYRERLALYQQGASFTSQPVAVRQATYLK
jgi:tetratricopeptide (TPR) repeat protein